MSLGISALGWLGLGTAIAGTAATIDANKAAKHQGRVQAEQQAQQFADADRFQREQLATQQRMQSEALAAQEAQQAAALAQAEKSAAESKALMDRNLKASEENMNRANQKRPNTGRILDEAQQAGRAGASGTMLTGPLGVDPSSLKLGRSTLLGQ
jgi:hypothetical protein